MTSVRMMVTRETPDGRVGVSGTLRCAPTRARTVVGDPDETVLPAPMAVEVGPTGRADVPLAATGPSWCWLVSWRSAAGSWDEWVAVPDSPAPVDWPDLMRVDPATLAPTATPEAAWDLALAETRAVAEAASAASLVEQVTLTGDLAYALPATASPGRVHSVAFTQAMGGGHTVTYGGNPVTVDLTAGAVTTVELHPAGEGYVVQSMTAAAQSLTGAGSDAAQRKALRLYAGDPVGRTVVLLIGSSNVYGYVAGANKPWAQIIATRLVETHTVINAGYSGRDPWQWLIHRDETGMTLLDDMILTNRPHVVVASFATQNQVPPGPSSATITYIERARSICARHGVRFVGSTPYASNGYTDAQVETLKWVANELSDRDIPVFDFRPIWGTPPILGAIDSGDGLHLNNAGHAEQAARIPTDMLSVHSPTGPIRLPATRQPGGITVPASATTDPEFITIPVMPASSWTIGVRVKCPATPKISVGLWSFRTESSRMRLRIPNADQIDLATGSGVVIPAVPFPTSTQAEVHVTVTYDRLRNLASLYLDGALVGTGAAQSAAWTYNTGLSLGSTAAGAPAIHATGYRFSDLTVHATALAAYDVAKLATGNVPFVSLHLAAGLRDGVGRLAGARLSTVFGQESVPVLNYATP